jgi:hypothetical protein
MKKIKLDYMKFLNVILMGCFLLNGCMIDDRSSQINSAVLTQLSSDKNLAVIYAYRPEDRESYLSAVSIWANNSLVAQLSNGRYQIIHLPQGRYTFRNNANDLRIENKLLLSDHIYYLKLAFKTDKTPAGLPEGFSTNFYVNYRKITEQFFNFVDAKTAQDDLR